MQDGRILRKTVCYNLLMKKRPVMVWVIFIFYLLSIIMTFASLHTFLQGVNYLNQSHPFWGTADLILSLLVGVLNFGAALELFMLRRLSVNLFIGALVLGVAGTFMQINLLGATQGFVLTYATVGWVVSVAVIFYSRSLLKKGILI